MMKIGIIGGGQLGLMIVEEALKFGVETVCLDPSEDAPAFALCDEAIVGEFNDPQALELLCSQCDVVTYEFENVPGDLLLELEQKYNIKQGIKPLFDSQDRLREKDNAVANGLKTPKYMAVDSQESLLEAIEMVGLPAVLKTRRFGYDGHGQMVLRTREDVAGAVDMLSVPCILEEFVSFDYEVSVVMVADKDEVISFPIGQNIHKGGILDLCIVRNGENRPVVASIESASREFMSKCGYKGILAIEFFVKGDEFFFNEMAPRPHNSGHYTIEGCTTNQYGEVVRFLMGEKLQRPELVADCVVMKNILGQDMEAARRIEAAAVAGCHVHLYGKSEVKPKRKMGHITYVGLTPEGYESEWSEKFVK